MKYKMIAFDLDGTLLDTLPDLVEATNHTLKEMNRPLRNREEVRISIGHGLVTLLEKTSDASKEEIEQFIKGFLEYYGSHANVKTIPYQGMKEVLEDLKQKGYILVVATNKDEDIAKEMIEYHFPGLFIDVAGYNYQREGKPSFDMFKDLLDKHNLTKEDLFFLGDSDVDAETIIKNDLNGCLVTWGFKTKEELKPYQLDKIDRVEDIITIVEK